jgi:competence protein ComEA
MMRRIVGGFIVLVLALAVERLGGGFRFDAESLPPLDSLATAASIGDTFVTPKGTVDPRPPAVPPAFLAHPLRYLSEAPVDSLQLLPGIGPVLAERLANARTGRSSFTDWEELLRVRGIGPKKLQRLRDLAGRSSERPADRR